MTAFRWLDIDMIYAIHDRQLAQHGGRSGVLHEERIISALKRPMHLYVYEKPDIADLTASYAYGIIKNHGFVDGNKRTAWVAARLFLLDNGFNLTFDQIEAFYIIDGVAAGTIPQDELACWFRQRII